MNKFFSMGTKKMDIIRSSLSMLFKPIPYGSKG